MTKADRQAAISILAQTNNDHIERLRHINKELRQLANDMQEPIWKINENGKKEIIANATIDAETASDLCCLLDGTKQRVGQLQTVIQILTTPF